MHGDLRGMSFIAYESIFFKVVANHHYNSVEEGNATRDTGYTGSPSTNTLQQEEQVAVTAFPRSMQPSGAMEDRHHTGREDFSHVQGGSRCAPSLLSLSLPWLEMSSVATQTTELCKDRLLHFVISCASVVDQTAHCL